MILEKLVTRKAVRNVTVPQLIEIQEEICLKRPDLRVTHDWELLDTMFPAYCPLIMQEQLARCFTAVLLQQPYCTDMTHCVILILFRRCKTGRNFVTLRRRRRFNWRINCVPRELIVYCHYYFHKITVRNLVIKETV